MGTYMIKIWKKMVLPMLFFITMLTFYFDFISVKVGIDNISLIGFNLLKNETIGYNTWMILVFLLGLSGFILSWLNGRIKYGIGFLLALAGIILLLVAQFSMIEAYSINNKDISSLKFKPAYWVCLGSFVVAGSRCYLLQYRTVQKKETVETKGVVNINIITQSNKANK